MRQQLCSETTPHTHALTHCLLHDALICSPLCFILLNDLTLHTLRLAVSAFTRR